ncbi:hypothetical protein E1B28_012687 [Marasmius oreades]|uniref:Uncharacterized protein n=1 Tax=Marasmius oreades TaxID=181124 RepID=A0A9P7RS39_9AGAR|nr:uncharacterized protein E1B28_012687 [Marasmius oreades]KAG7088719.1 hypothetical protein E1B28_012687 [Marasmius oreades]
MNTSDTLENDINSTIEILSVLIATALSGTHSRNEFRRMRAETIQRECTVFLQLLQDRDLEQIEDRWEDFWEETMDNFEASNRYLQDLNMSNMSDPGTASPEFELWRKVSREYNNLLEWLPRLKQGISKRAKRSPPLSSRKSIVHVTPPSGVSL